MITLKVREKDEAEKILTFEKELLMFGRVAGNDVILEKGGVSRYHATLTREGTNLVLADAGSTNGTFVGSEKINDRRVLQPGEAFVIGEAVISAEYQPDESFEFKDSFASTVAPVEAKPVEVPATAPAVEAPPAPKPSTAGALSSEFYWQSLKSFLAPVWEYLIDDSVSEVLINGKDEIYIERKGKLESIDVTFSSDLLNAAVLNIAQYVGRRVSEEEPYMDARLPDGSRVAVLLPPCSRKGVSVSIRKFAKEKLTLDKLISFGSLSPEMVTFLDACVRLKKNIIVSGGTSSGKTSLLNVVSGLIPDDERILTIEDAAELQLRQRHVVPMETRPPDKKGRGQVTIRDLVRASLRMRPDRIVVGEIRSGEALDLLQAMNTGHSGSMATVHASSPLQAMTRLETLALFSGIEIPMRALREQVATAIDIVVQAARLPDHSRKVTHISEVGPLKEDGSYQVHDIFRFVRTGSKDGKLVGHHEWTGHVPESIGEMELSGLQNALQLFQGGSTESRA